ncbi:hypothetical protein MYX77_06970 [Acidobacteriia bacterium AH_259_A11_L15]|nr:hypothetical protein [Acidobacteriia bacterium AH_259_A11_L15]
MAKKTARKLGLEIDARLYAHLDRVAKANGQTRRFLLEKALKHYLEVVVPSQGTVRPQVMAHYRQSVDKNRKLLELLAR